jgi:riboflavin synthase
MNLNTYLQNIEEKVEKSRKTHKSKIEEKLYNIVIKNIEENKPNTIKVLQNELSHKHSSYLHQLIKKSDRLTKVKVKGLSVVVPAKQDKEEETSEEESE